MPTKLLLLTGAPESSRLDWTPSTLLTTFHPTIAEFALFQPPAPSPPPPSSTTDQAVWRSLPLHRTHIRTGFSQAHDLLFAGAFPSSADFLNTVQISFDAAAAASQGRLSQDDADAETSRLIADFYEHSLAVHGDQASSQLVPHPDSQQKNDESSFVSDTTTGEDSTTIADTTLTAHAPKPPLYPGGGGGAADHLSDLEDIPPASYLLSITPATMTVTLIAGIISIASPRTITTHYGAAKQLVEVLVGDDTKSGFSVTFWLSANPNDGATADVLRGLRRQDVVLLQNVGLRAFRGKVYGGSLRRGLTRVGLLYRRGVVGEEDEVGGYYDAGDLRRAEARGDGVSPQLAKTGRVRDWVLRFVGGGPGGGEEVVGKARKGKEKERQWNQPPPLDSQ